MGAGEVYALLGLNGAGKTTLIRMLLGMVRPTAGRLEVAGRPVADRSVWAQVGYLVETPSAYPDLTVRENLEVARRLRRLPDAGVVDEAVDRFGLGQYEGSKARTLSLGNAQRLGLAKAMLHRPQILVLDEPVNGLDPAGVVEIRDLLIDLAREDGVTVLLSSHLLSEVARVATRIGILHEGRLIEEMDSTTLEASTRTRLEVESRDATRAAEILRGAGFEVQRRPATPWCSRAGRCCTLRRSRRHSSRAGSHRPGSSWSTRTSRPTSCASSATTPPPTGAPDDCRAAGGHRGRADQGPPGGHAVGHRSSPSSWPPASGRSSCSCCRTPHGHGRWACWAPRRSSVAARPTGPATSRWSRRWSRSAGCCCSG